MHWTSRFYCQRLSYWHWALRLCCIHPFMNWWAYFSNLHYFKNMKIRWTKLRYVKLYYNLTRLSHGLYSPCFFGRSTVNLCSTSRVLPCSVPKRAPFPSITMNPNLLSSANSAVKASVWNCNMIHTTKCQTKLNVHRTYASSCTHLEKKINL